MARRLPALQSLERFTLRRKLVAGMGLVLLLPLALGAVGLGGIHGLNRDMEVVYSELLQVTSQVSGANRSLRTTNRVLRQLLLDPRRGSRTLLMAQVRRQGLLLSQSLETRQAGGNPVLQAAIDEARALSRRYLDEVDRLLNLLGDGPELPAAAVAAYGSGAFNASLEALDLQLDQVEQLARGSAQRANERARMLHRQADILILVLMLSGLAVGGLVAVLLGASISRPLNRVRRAVEQLAAGDLDQEVPCLDHPTELGALTLAIDVLRRGAMEMESQRWLKSNEAVIIAELQQVDRFAALPHRLFSALATSLPIGQGAFYIVAGDPDHPRLSLLGGYALRERKALRQQVALGEGLVGQCALERSPIVLQEPPAAYFSIGSSLGEAPPASSVCCRCCAASNCWRWWNWPPSAASRSSSRSCSMR